MKTSSIPLELRFLNQWVMWRSVDRDGKITKVPFQPNGDPAKSNDPSTWCDFETVAAALEKGGYTGIGFMFSPDGDYCGIDLDGCRCPDTGAIAPWARKIVEETNTYSEVSPSETGVKMFVKAKLAMSGRKKDLDHKKLTTKTPGIEIYDRGRYFAVTGLKLSVGHSEPQERQQAVNDLCNLYWPESPTRPAVDFQSDDAVVERARKYVAKAEPAVSGSSGHNATFSVACALVLGFSLTNEQALSVLAEWNQTCQPPWSQKDLEHKIKSADQQPGDRGYLRNANPRQYDRITIPAYKEPEPPKSPARSDDLSTHIRLLQDGINTGKKATLIKTGLPGLDASIGGGVEPGEMVILAARPSHGKSLVGLQCVHYWTANDMPVVFITEEMSPRALAKRTLQFSSPVPEEEWKKGSLDGDIEKYTSGRARCRVVEGCGSAENAVLAIETAIDDYGAKAAIVDYAQLLKSKGSSRYDEASKTSEALRRLANKTGIILLVMCQLNRQIESRKQFIPLMSDIKETGQFEQDADVIVFLVWPHRIDPTQPANEFTFFIAKNRNRGISDPVVKCHIEPSRQRLTKERPSWAKDVTSYEDTPKPNGDFGGF